MISSSLAICHPCMILQSQLSWKLVLSHVAVASRTVTLVKCAYALRAIITQGDDVLIDHTLHYDPDFAQGTRLLALF